VARDLALSRSEVKRVIKVLIGYGYLEVEDQTAGGVVIYRLNPDAGVAVPSEDERGVVPTEPGVVPTEPTLVPTEPGGVPTEPQNYNHEPYSVTENHETPHPSQDAQALYPLRVGDGYLSAPRENSKAIKAENKQRKREVWDAIGTLYPMGISERDRAKWDEWLHCGLYSVDTFLEVVQVMGDAARSLASRHVTNAGLQLVMWFTECDATYHQGGFDTSEWFNQKYGGGTIHVSAFGELVTDVDYALAS
jgi:hypothetical protein